MTLLLRVLPGRPVAVELIAMSVEVMVTMEQMVMELIAKHEFDLQAVINVIVFSTARRKNNANVGCSMSYYLMSSLKWNYKSNNNNSVIGKCKHACISMHRNYQPSQEHSYTIYHKSLNFIYIWICKHICTEIV